MFKTNTMRIIKTIILSSAIISLICGCSVNKQTDTVTNQTVSENEETESNSTELTYPLTIRVGYSTSKEDPRGIALNSFKKEVEAASDKNIIIEIHPDGELGSDAELIAGMISKDVDMTVSSAGNYAAYATRIGVSALPFLFEDFESAWAFIDSDIMKSVSVDLDEYNMHVLAYFDNGFRCVTTSSYVGPINKVSDMEGLNIRTPDNQIVMETMSELSANPRSYPFAQLKDALTNKEFDAQENPIPVIYNNKLYEVQKYLSITNHSYDAMPLTIRNDIWEALPADYQNIISQAAIKAQDTNRSLVKKQTDDFVASLEENGMIVNNPDLKPFKDATKGVMEVFSNVYGKELIDAIKKIK